ncbi:TIGR02530 family flagellar biosynthesis protein [Pseudalkalibacillus caeni]|uniref:Flagellar protein n=1 Tax=Exobacillus caeni TaxID=2574798 RepID=A0A5R9EZI2_9BACL|nr:TIGR02530 family flagellar biosynthesis protein [Pseudalkalibacillus caeni]TLS36637.1 flagellar protein [Pseudalkalibacillus caeni]
MSQFRILKPYVPNQQPITKTIPQPKSKIGDSNTSFSDQLQKTLNNSDVKFSKHAKLRLQEQGIQLSDEELNRLSNGVDKAKQKGAKESLFLMNNNAFVVSVKNETVITAMKQNNMEEQIITNIDSAVLL